MRYRLSYREVAEFFLMRDFEFTHETVRDWEERFAGVFQEELRAKRRGKIGNVWYVDETYIKVKGKWCYLYRAIDHKGNLVDSMLSPKRDLEAAKAFLKQASTVASSPEKIVTDGLSSYPRAIGEALEEEVEHEVRGCQGNPVEPSHRRVKQRYYPTLGFAKFDCAQRFCQTVDEIAQFFRPRERMTEFVSLSETRKLFQERISELRVLFQTA
jgi:putative transposase